jgi:hypothetical protein
MRWPFKSHKSTDIRIFKDPKTGDVTLRLVGPVNFPTSASPILTVFVTLNVKLDEEGINRLFDQLGQYVSDQGASH